MLEIQVKYQINVRNVCVINIDSIKKTSQNNKINKIKTMNINLLFIKIN